jgi:ATP-binding cassette subfamily B protein
MITVYVGAIEVFDGNLTIGNIAEFLIYVYLLTWPVTALGWITSIIQRASASQRRINEFLDEKNTIKSSSNKKLEIKGAVEFKNVCFKYQDTGIDGMDNISFKLKAGDSLGIIGSTGSGKSTIANSILRLFDIDSGKILIDNVSIKDLDTSYFRRQVGYVPQDVFLFSDTIENNILFGSEDNIQKVKTAAENSDLMRNIESFPNKFNTKIGERGITLSGGQKQRISIARAIIKEPKLLILDDCLSAVDTKTENVILENLKKIMIEKTSIIISHRISSVKLAKNIIVIENGKIIEEGDHKTLLETKGNYYKLYKQQIESEKSQYISS